MALKWIKLKTDIFTSDKMLLLETYEDGLYYQMIWLKLLCLAGRKENHGIFMMRDGRGYTAPMLSHILSVDTDILDDALSVFEELCMISNDGGIIKILGWREHQEDYFDDDEPQYSEEERLKRMNRERVRNYRRRQKQINEPTETEEGNERNDEAVTDSITGNDYTITPSITCNDLSITESLPLININNRTEQNKEEHTSLREEREKNKKEETVTENDNGENLSFSHEERDFENSFSLNDAVYDTAVDKDEEIQMPSPSPPSPLGKKEPFGAFDNVFLSDTEYNAFREKFPEDYADRIDELSIYLATSGKEYKNHYATLLSFARMRYAKNSPPPYQDYSSTASGPPSLQRKLSGCSASLFPITREGLKYADFDPEEELQKAIRRSGFFDDEDE